MKRNPLVSVIMSTYNEKLSWIREAVDSILTQTYENIEFIIIIDNPENNEIIEYLQTIEDRRVRVVINEENIGLVKSLNKAIKLCNGKYIARMDADDISIKSRIENQINILENNENIVLLGCNVRFINDKGNEINTLYKDVTCGFKYIREHLKYENCMIHPTFIMRKDIITNDLIQGYREVFSAEDYDLVCRLIEYGYDIENTDKELLLYRVRINSITRKNELTQIRIANYIKKLYREKKMQEIDFKYIDKLRSNKRGYKSFTLSNKIKGKVCGGNKLKKIIYHIFANCISKYHLIRVIYKIRWKAKKIKKKLK